MEEAGVNSDTLLLDALFGGVMDAVIVIDAKGLIVRASASVENYFGWKAEELLGQNISVLVPEPHRSAHDGYLERYRKTGKTWILGSVREFDVVRRDGSLLPCELSVSRIDRGGGEPPLFCGSFRDITDRMRARAAMARSEARFRAVFEHENQLVLLLDADGRIVEANAPALIRIGMGPHSIEGAFIADAILWNTGPGNRETIERAYREAQATGLAVTRANVCIGARSDCEPRPHDVSIRVLEDAVEGSPAAIVELRDISALVESERRESAVIRSLARVGEESAVLAHELRSPVSSLELALKAVGRQLGAQESVLLEDLAKRMRWLEELLTRTLRFSKPLELHKVAVSCNEAFGTALEHEGQMIKQAGIRPTVSVASGTPPLLADPSALGDLLTNLVRNAAEAQAGTDAPLGGRLELRAEPLCSHRGPGPFVRLMICDDGPGVPEPQREAMFRLFRTEKEDGTGLGLALVRKIAEEHGATVALEGGLHGSGLCVVLEWPAFPENPID